MVIAKTLEMEQNFKQGPILKEIPLNIEEQTFKPWRYAS